MRYERCERCEINFKPVGEPYCEICRREIKGELWDYGEDEKRICPDCGIRVLSEGEECCKVCREKLSSSYS